MGLSRFTCQSESCRKSVTALDVVTEPQHRLCNRKCHWPSVSGVTSPYSTSDVFRRLYRNWKISGIHFPKFLVEHSSDFECLKVIQNENSARRFIFSRTVTVIPAISGKKKGCSKTSICRFSRNRFIESDVLKGAISWRKILLPGQNFGLSW